MDLGTGLAILGSKELMVKILGPTADYVGNSLQFWTERGSKNVARIFTSAKEKLGSKLNQPGIVPPKVLKGVLEEGPFCDDELGAEYFGGVLASSRTAAGRDDRGACLVGLVGRLSTYQIRSHFIFYSAVHALYQGSTENIGVVGGRHRLRTFIPFGTYLGAMEFDADENKNVQGILEHAMFGLSREALIEGPFLYGGADGLRQLYQAAEEPGIVFAPSALGVELFLWALGKGGVSLPAIFSTLPGVSSTVKLKPTTGICSVEFPDKKLP